jgi:hypothetical protein
MGDPFSLSLDRLSWPKSLAAPRFLSQYIECSDSAAHVLSRPTFYRTTIGRIIASYQ